VVPFSVGVLGGTSDTYQKAGPGRGTATKFHDYRGNLSAPEGNRSLLDPGR
jgi:hypothetical protein